MLLLLHKQEVIEMYNKDRALSHYTAMAAEAESMCSVSIDELNHDEQAEEWRNDHTIEVDKRMVDYLEDIEQNEMIKAHAREIVYESEEAQPILAAYLRSQGMIGEISDDENIDALNVFIVQSVMSQGNGTQLQNLINEIVESAILDIERKKIEG